MKFTFLLTLGLLSNMALSSEVNTILIPLLKDGMEAKSLKQQLPSIYTEKSKTKARLINKLLTFENTIYGSTQERFVQKNGVKSATIYRSAKRKKYAELSFDSKGQVTKSIRYKTNGSVYFSCSYAREVLDQSYSYDIKCSDGNRFGFVKYKSNSSIAIYEMFKSNKGRIFVYDKFNVLRKHIGIKSSALIDNLKEAKTLASCSTKTDSVLQCDVFLGSIYLNQRNSTSNRFGVFSPRYNVLKPTVTSYTVLNYELKNSLQNTDKNYEVISSSYTSGFRLNNVLKQNFLKLNHDTNSIVKNNCSAPNGMCNSGYNSYEVSKSHLALSYRTISKSLPVHEDFDQSGKIIKSGQLNYFYNEDGSLQGIYQGNTSVGQFKNTTIRNDYIKELGGIKYFYRSSTGLHSRTKIDGQDTIIEVIYNDEV